MNWLNEPPLWSAQGAGLTFTTAPKSDFWRKTHYGFIRDNGHVYATAVTGDFVATARFTGAYTTLYDQAGLMVRADEENWLKCGIEYVEGIHYASAVVTRDFSDWSVSPMGPTAPDLNLRVTREGATLTVEVAVGDGPLGLLRSAYLPMGDQVLVGPMACSPGELGFAVTFSDWSVTPSGDQHGD